MTTTDTIYDILLTSLSTDGAIRISGGTVGGATEATLVQVRDNLADIEGYVDELETLTGSLVTLNTQIEASTDGLETLLTSLTATTDGIEGLIAASNTALSAIETAVNNLESFTDGIEASLTSIDGKFNSLGQKTASGSVPVVLASDQGNLNVVPVTDASTASALTAVTASTATTTILSSNSNRKRAYLFNDSSSSAVVALSTTATSTLYTHKMGPYGFWEVPGDPVWRGAIAAIWDVANGALRVTELT